ncbi:MAG: FAD binding domain-containing protein, partial [Spirochaetales bacterium]|nr:FAD binding domain-containing protein [Spirochaetales bacterium]
MAEKFVVAESAKEAASLKNGSSVFLAGGTEINRLGSPVDARTLISIGRLQELDGISVLDDCIRIGAMCTFQDVIDSREVPSFLKEACLFMGSRTKRNMATIGGNIAAARTDSYLCATLLACHAGLLLADGEGKQIRRCVKGYLEDRKQ